MPTEAPIVRCPNCGRQNRVPPAASGLPHCGVCGATLPWLTEAGEADYPAVVEQSTLPVLVDFWAPWCGPCRIVSPIVEQISHDYNGKIRFVKMNTDENELAPMQFG